MGTSAGVAFLQLAVIQDSGFHTKLPGSHAARRAAGKHAPAPCVLAEASEELHR